MQSTAELLQLAANLKHLSSVGSHMKRKADDTVDKSFSHEGEFLFLTGLITHLLNRSAAGSSSGGVCSEDTCEKAKPGKKKRSQVKDGTDKVVIDWLKSELTCRVGFKTFEMSHHSNSLQNPEIVMHWNFAAKFCTMFYNQKCPVNVSLSKPLPQMYL